MKKSDHNSIVNSIPRECKNRGPPKKMKLKILLGKSPPIQDLGETEQKIGEFLNIADDFDQSMKCASIPGVNNSLFLRSNNVSFWSSMMEIEK